MKIGYVVKKYPIKSMNTNGNYGFNNIGGIILDHIYERFYPRKTANEIWNMDSGIWGIIYDKYIM